MSAWPGRVVRAARAGLAGLALAALAAAPSQDALAQQQADPNFSPTVSSPAFGEGRGPVVLIDEAHFNFHTASGRYAPFAELLARDGYQVRPSNAPFSAEALAGADILVIANAVSPQNRDKPVLPTYPAFAPAEIAAVDAFVEDGGALLLIADHMPWGGGAAGLAEAFGIFLSDGFAIRKDGTTSLTFSPGDGGLADHPVARGRDPGETIASVMSFTGQAFRAAPGAAVDPVMVLGPDTLLLLPAEAWQFSQATPRLAAAGLLQGATLSHGKGRVAVFGEAGMFTAQLTDGRGPMGMNHPQASGNQQFVLNVLHWLSRLL